MSSATQKPAPGTYAGAVSRLVAFAVNATIIVATVLVVAALVESIEGFFALYRASALFAPWRFVLQAFTAVFTVGFPVAYPIVFWAMFGETPGMALLGIRLVRLDGRQISWWTAIVRYVGSWLSAILLFIGFAWVLIDDRRRGWNDHLAGTCVVYVVKARAQVIGRPTSRALERTTQTTPSRSLAPQ